MSLITGDLIYVFDIKTKGGKKYHLTSSSIEQKIQDVRYKPNSGLSFVSGEFDESGQNHVLLHGIFEQGGIEKKDNLAGASVGISFLNSNDLVPFISYFCTKYTGRDLDFHMRCEPEVIKYNQSLLQMFSKTCRANFGDDKCKVLIADYAIKSEISKVVGNTLKCDIKGFADGYFKGGTLSVSDEEGNRYEFKVLSHFDNNIEINLNIEFDFNKHKSITLVPGCDKNYRTCCYSFDNAVNFRGEPVIPESSIIEN